ncbi:GNAT family N-acetyltransferase [Deinococcus aquiradiocola]|uniref:N-acetyltransferase n=1 Tax=Deinococcus aquiradiocola TaxID=393059 RepID=A0A917PE56_9DEIO|nr:GNAT family N-acetyltransferase [Deinococcus aquiradiocola]GGJ72561.1 N-acetyltransferase [Deinococcus aquiradiocola]
MNASGPLRGARVTLRPLQPGDAPALAAYRDDPLVARYQGWPLPSTLADAQALVTDMQGRRAGDPGWTQLAVTLPASPGPGDTLIGDVALHVQGREGEIGVTLARAHHGHGYAAEALNVLLDHALGPLGLTLLRAEIDPRNLPVLRLLQRLHFRHHETQVGTYLHRGEWTDNAVYTLTPADRQARPAPGHPDEAAHRED